MARALPEGGRGYPCVDLTKLIMAVCVIALHTRPLDGCTNAAALRLYDAVTACAVPYFFLASGFFLARGLEYPYRSRESMAAIGGYLKRIVRLYLLWSILYFPLALAYYIGSGRSFAYCAVYYLRGLILIGEHYNSWMLWYLLSAAYALLFILLLLRRGASFRLIVLLGGAVFLLGCFFDELTAGDAPLPAALSALRTAVAYIFENGRIFRGFLYVPLGMELAHARPRPPVSWALLAAGFLAELLFGGAAGSVGTAACAAGLFCLTLDVRLRPSPRYTVMRKMSTILYFIHMYVWTIVYTVLYGGKTYGPWSFLLTTSVCILIASGCLYLRRRRREAI